MNKSATIVLLLTAAVFLLSAPAAAQPGDNSDQPRDDADLGANGVYIATSDDAAQRIRWARNLAKAGQWDQAAQVLHEVYTRFGGKLLASPDGLNVGVGEIVGQMLAQWPAEGLSIYRRRYDGLAKSAYEKAVASADAMEMAAVARQYWASTIGPRAADEAAEMALESGRFSAAIELWCRLLDSLPKVGDEKTDLPPLLAKLAVASAWGGQAKLASQYRARLAKKFADWPNSFGGTGKTLLAWVDANSGSLLASNRDMTAGSHPLLGGGANRNEIPSSKLDFGARIWEFGGHKTNIQPTNNPVYYQNNGMIVPAGSRQSRAPFMLYPILVDNVLYVSSPGGVYALPATSGKPELWHNSEIVATSVVQNNRYGGVMPLYSPSYWQGRLYVDYGSAVMRNYYGGNPGGRGGGLACLDAATGKLLWKLDVDTIPGLQGGFLDSSPVAVGGRVYMVVHVAQFFDTVSLVAADARTGKVIWSQQISSADSGAAYYSVRAQDSLPAVEGNAIYVATNLGTVAAISAETGQVRWVRQYVRNNRMLGDRMGFSPPPQPSKLDLGFSPTIAWKDKVIVAPSDCDDLMILDGHTGQVVACLNRKAKLFDMSEMYGVVDDVLIGRGNQVFAWDLSKNRIVWAISPDAAPTYRGQLSREYLYLPTEKFLLRFSLADKGRQDRFAWQQAGETKGYDGTILLNESMIITANSERICGYCEWPVAERMALTAIEKATPEKRPDRILDYAGYAYMTQHMKLAQEQLARAVEDAGGFDNLIRPDLKKRVFINALEFAEETWKKDPQATLELLQMASLCPPDVEGQVRYRMALGRYWNDNRNYPEAVRYYQEVLADSDLRKAKHYLGEENKVDAGPFARDQIDGLISARGKEAYAAVNDQAERDYSRAVASADWSELDRLILQYPNAVRTREEIFRLADHLAGQSQYEDAINWLRYLRREYSRVLESDPKMDARTLSDSANYAMKLRDRWLAATTESQRVRESRARTALRQAYAFVLKGRKLPADMRVNIAGAENSFVAHRQDMLDKYGKQLQMLPQVMGPLAVGQTPQLPPNSRVLKPLIGNGPSSNDDIILVSAQSGASWDFRGYRPLKSNEPLWTRKYDQQRGPATNLVTYFEDAAIITQMHRIKAVNPESGDILWTAELSDERQNGYLRAHAVFDTFLFCAGQSNAMVVDMETGKVISQFKLPDQNVYQADMGEEALVCLARSPQIVASVIDWRTGKLLSRITPAPDTAYVTIGEGSRAAVCFARSGIAAYDIKTGKRLWNNAGNNMAYNYSANTVQARGNAVYCMERDAKGWTVVALDAQNGKKMWAQRLSQDTARPNLNTGMSKLVLQDDELIAYADNSIVVLDVDKGQISYVPFIDPTDYVRDLVVSQDYLIVLTGPHPNMAFRAGRAQQEVEVRLYDRTPGGGRLEQKITIGLEGYGQPLIVPANPGLVVHSQGMPKMTVLKSVVDEPKRK